MFTARVTESWEVPEAIQALFLLERPVEHSGEGAPMFQVRQRDTGRRLWLKCAGPDEWSGERLVAEATILTAAKHPHILSLEADFSGAEPRHLVYPWQAERPLDDTTLQQLSDPDRVRLALDLVNTVAHLQALDPPVVHTTVSLARMWVTPGTSWLRLAGFDASHLAAGAEELTADRAAVWDVVSQLMPDPTEELQLRGTEWVDRGPEKLPPLAQELHSVFLGSVATDL
jgi:hypothetical protein